MTIWVGAFDESSGRVPISRMGEAYAAGYRVLGGYAGGGSTAKWLTRREIDAWLAQGPGTGVAGLFEIYGTEPIDFPSAGAGHARRARAAWRALGYPDNAAIFVAVDEDVSLAQAHAQLTAYFRSWAAVDTCLPVVYVEADAGAILKADGCSAGTFTPAAWGWNNPAMLYTSANAPAHVVWTQERNGRLLFGGNLDIGHIRTDAPIMWRDRGTHADVGVDMPITQADADLVAATLLKSLVDAVPVAEQNIPGLTVRGALRQSAARTDRIVNIDDPADAARDAALSAKLDALAVAIAAHPGATTGGSLDAATVRQIFDDELAKADTASAAALTAPPTGT